VAVDELTELRALPRPLAPQQVPGGQMGVAVVLGGRDRSRENFFMNAAFNEKSAKKKKGKEFMARKDSGFFI
jgi:hypothetical protein